MGNRPAVHIYVTEEAHEFLYDGLTTLVGCSVSALVNAVGLLYRDGHTLEQILGTSQQGIRQLITKANKIFAARRRRKAPDGDDEPQASEERRALHCYLATDAHESFKELVEEFFASDASFVQALADWLQEQSEAIGFNALEQQLNLLVRRAREYDADNRRRGS